MTVTRSLARLVLLSTSLLGGCGDGRPPAERVAEFCKGVRAGEQFEAVKARYASFQIQSRTFAPPPQERLKDINLGTGLNLISGILVEDTRSIGKGPRPVCAIYYSNELLGGNGKVVLSEFLAAWSDQD